MLSKKSMLFFVVIFVSLILAACTSTTPAETAPTVEPVLEQRSIVLGDISDDPAEVIEGFQPFADYLAAELKDYGITIGEVKIARDADEMIELLSKGEVDLYFDSIYPATLVSDASGGQVILRRWRFGIEEYQSVIFTSKDSGITSLSQLNGRKIAFDNQLSTSGFVLPAMHLSQYGITLVGKEDYNASVSPGEVGFVFSYDDENTLQWILNGFVDAAATDDYYYEHLFSAEVRENLVELARTDFVPRQVVVVTPMMTELLEEEVIRVLLTAHETEAGLAALDPFQTSKFDRFPEGIEEASASMRQMIEIIDAIPLK